MARTATALATRPRTTSDASIILMREKRSTATPPISRKSRVGANDTITRLAMAAAEACVLHYPPGERHLIEKIADAREGLAAPEQSKRLVAERPKCRRAGERPQQIAEALLLSLLDDHQCPVRYVLLFRLGFQ